MENKRVLYRDTDDKILGGVASGLAAFVNWDVTVMRFAFILGWLSIPSFTLAYILAWIIIPNKYNPSNQFSIGKLILVLFVCALPIIAFIGSFVFLLFYVLFNPF